MQILEELGTFVVSVALALAILGAAAVVLYYFNPQQPVDHAKAAFYPLVKPLNKTHVWLGVKPSADRVEVVELKYQYRGRWVDVPVARLTADRAVWLNATDGRPAAVPCSANVTVATRYGTAMRSLSFTPVCIQRQDMAKTSLTSLEQALISYADYVLDYVFYARVPVMSAFFRFGSINVAFQNIGKYPYMVLDNLTSPGFRFYITERPSFRALTLVPEDVENIYSIPSRGPNQELFTRFVKLLNNTSRWEGNTTLHIYDYNPSAPTQPQYIVSEMYRWLNIAVFRNGSNVMVWLNGARAYNGTGNTVVIQNVTKNVALCRRIDSGGCSLTWVDALFALTNGTAIGYNVTVALPGCPVVHIHNSPVAALRYLYTIQWIDGRYVEVYDRIIGPIEIENLLKTNGYDPNKNLACKNSLNTWKHNLTWGYSQYVYSKPIAVAKLVKTPLGLHLGVANDTLYLVYTKEYFTGTDKLIYAGSYYRPVIFQMRDGTNSTYIPLSSWSGWVYLQNVQIPYGNLSVSKTYYLMPSGPLFGNRTDGRWKYYVLGVVPPLRSYNLHLSRSPNGLTVQWADPTCGLSANCTKKMVLSTPGIYYIALHQPSSRLPTFNIMLHYIDTYVAMAVLNPAGRWKLWNVQPGVVCSDMNVQNPWAIVPSLPGDISWYDAKSCCKNNECHTYLVASNSKTFFFTKDGEIVHQLPVAELRANRPLTATVYWDGKTHVVGYTFGDEYNLRLFYAVNSTTAIPVMFEYTGPIGAYVYNLTTEVKAAAVKKHVHSVNNPDGSTTYYTFANYSYVGYVQLTFDNGKLASYDAIYGWGIVLVDKRTETPPPPPPPTISNLVLRFLGGPPNGTCVPAVSTIEAGILHRNLQKTDKGYSVEVYKRYIVTTTGCGYNETHETFQYVTTVTANGQDYHVIDRNGNMCGFKDACNGPDGWVQCYCQPDRG
jgi:hypothetical protein